MKILMINVVCGIRSTGRICTDLAKALEADGNEVKIAYGRETVPEQFRKYAVRIGSDTDVRLHGVRARLLDGCGFGSKRATERFIDWVKDYDPDVIHLHNLHGYYINLPVLFAYLRTCGKRIIWTLHDCWAFTGHSAFCDAVDCELWKTGCCACPLMKDYPSSYTDHSRSNWQKKKALLTGIPDMTLVTPSEWLAGLVKKSFIKEYPVKVINNGIDTSKFYPVESDFKTAHGIDDKKMLLGVATAWNDMKGLSDFIKLADLLPGDYQIVLVGLTRKQLKDLPENIIGIERTNSIEELVRIYSAADALLSLSYCETYPTVNLEARACGTPVITYDAGGSAEAAGEGGYVVEKGDLQGVVDALKDLKSERVTAKVRDKARATEQYLAEYNNRKN